MQANRTQKYYSNIVKITHFFRLHSSTCAYINYINRKCSYTIQYKGILYRKCALCKYGNIFMTFLECAQRKQRRSLDIWHTKVAMTLFGINTFSVLHSAGPECRLQLSKVNQSLCYKTKRGGGMIWKRHLNVPVCCTHNTKFEKLFRVHKKSIIQKS